MFIWRRSDDHFGGFSAIEVAADGGDFIALTDRTFMFEGRFLRDAAGAIVGIEDGPRHRLLDVDGNPLRRPRADSEGLAVAPDGTFYIAFEGLTRVRRQMGVDGEPVLLPSHPDFERLRSNESLEALAIGPDGALYAIPERPLGPSDTPFPVYRFRGEEWDIPFTLPRRGRFLVTGADIGPDGRIYVLERDFLGLGFRSRVRRFALDGSDEVVLLETPLGLLDNMEGISIWGEAGDLRMTLIADNNFNPFQRNLIAEYLLPD
ncbi:MAG: esterase-like activity of phytase family protein [Rubellimicrobium sp.]|nr:esterase-like activity of phytase family protein [Rubellimicrobium sp.]